LSRRVDWNVRGQFTQTVYSDDTAQYVLGAFSDLDIRLSDQWRANLSYNRQKPAGFTPFRFDFVSRYESLDLRVSCQQGDRLMFSLSGGRDLERNRYRDIILRLQYSPNQSYYASLSTGYSIENTELRDVLLRLSLFSGDRFELDTTTRYSPRTHDISRIRAYLYWQVTDKWRIEGITGFNGFTNEFDFNQFRITRDLHCWEAFLTWDQQRRELRLDLALKAFPGLDTRFGVGATGQALDVSAGQIF